VLRIWCAPHQIFIVANTAAKGIQDGIYVKHVPKKASTRSRQSTASC
jgi:hypothetical protein